MENNEVNKQPIPQQVVEAPVLSSHFHLPRVFLVLIVAIFSGTLFGMLGYYAGLTNQTLIQQSHKTTTTVTHTQSIARSKIHISPKNSFVEKTWRDYFSFTLPSGFYQNDDSSKQTNCIAVSTVKNSADLGIKVPIQGNMVIDMCYWLVTAKTSQTFTYDGGSNTNPTIHQFSINGYTGIKGKQQDSFFGGETDVIQLQDHGGMIEIQSHGSIPGKLDQLLRSLKINQ